MCVCVCMYGGVCVFYIYLGIGVLFVYCFFNCIFLLGYKFKCYIRNEISLYSVV